MAGAKIYTEGQAGFICNTATGGSPLSSIEGINPASLQDGAVAYDRATDTSYRFFDQSLAAPAPPNVIIPLGQSPAVPGRWLIITGGGGGGGTVTAGANVGAGTGLSFRDITGGGTTMNFRTLVGLGGIAVTTVGNVINIDGSGITGGVTAGANVGAGTGQSFRDITGGTTMNFRTLVGLGGIAVTTVGDVINIDGSGIGAGATWAQVLINGNTSGARDAIIESAQFLRGTDAAAGDPLNLRGGNATGAGAGAAVNITGGLGNGVGASAGVNINGASSTAPGTGAGVVNVGGGFRVGALATGGELNLSTAGTSDAAGAGADLTIQTIAAGGKAGNIFITAQNTSGGAAQVGAGITSRTGNGGSGAQNGGVYSIYCGSAGTTGGTGGQYYAAAGPARLNVSSNAGAMYLLAGTCTGTGTGDGDGGAWIAGGGDSKGTGVGGIVSLGSGGAPGTGNSGTTTISTGAAPGGAAGDLSLNGGSGLTQGANINLTPGASVGTPGHVNVRLAGAVQELRVVDTAGPTTVFSVDAAGNVFIAGKLTVVGIIDPTGLVLSEQATVPGGAPGATNGTFWVNANGVGINQPFFTDGFGIDHRLAYQEAIETTSIVSPNIAVNTVLTNPGTSHVIYIVNDGLTITMPPAPSGNAKLTIKGTATTTNITILPNAGQTIEGAASQVLSNPFASITVIYLSATSTWVIWG